MTEPAKGTILIVEDTEEFRDIYSDAIAADGYEVLEARDGMRGLELAKKRKPDLILLDLMLPGIDGFRVLEAVRDNRNIGETPVIVFSVFGDRNRMERAEELGADDYIEKGAVQPSDVIKVIHEVLAKAHQQTDTPNAVIEASNAEAPKG